ncbi:PadR family transcriptional regulator [Actinomadura sp. DC4]|uniref:PadR family transcriptional regulator n=1 Tax=Actinomadura sp. DC4 TaxID=3055069 RepID=UPI0025B041EC|nr:PadR family transcriptional regulator [Actinomadura sp. DC4]MDN3356146.1 PadR family transcriptional regulator [Actinomadura sp. DC4]
MEHWPHGPHDPAAHAAMGGPGAPPGPPGPPPGPPGFPPPLPGAPPIPGLFGPGPMPHGAAPKVRKGDVRAAALALLAEGPRNGYQIIQEITERSHGIWRPSPGSVYPALQQLEDEGLVRAEEEGGRRTYRLTGEGRTHVADNREELTEPWAAVAESVSEEMVDLRALFMQLGMAMRQVMEAGTPAQHARTRQILTETRRSLYRLLAEEEDE